MDLTGKLEQRVSQLIQAHAGLRSQVEESREVERRLKLRIEQLEAEVAALKNQLDQRGRDRFKLRKMADERRHASKLVNGALERLTRLEEHLVGRGEPDPD